MTDNADDEESWSVHPLVLEDLFRGLFTRDKLRTRWVEEAAALAHELQETPPHRHAAALFCVRLYGTLREVHPAVREGVESFGEQPGPDELEAAYDELLAALNDLRAVLSREELLWLEYQRDAESHPWLSAYDHRHFKRREDGIRQSRNSEFIGGSVPLVDYKNAIKALTMGTTVDLAAVSLARKTAPALRRVLDAARRCEA